MSRKRARAPIIGITTYGPMGAAKSFGLPQAYVSAVSRAGGVAVLLPSTESVPCELFELLDGLVLAGGGDVDPARYSEERHEKVYGIAPERDQFELALVERALATPRLPVLGICRGMQLLNVATGGDLEQHLPENGVTHRVTEGRPAFHEVSLTAGGVFEEIYGALAFPVNSRHHQGVRRIGAGCEVAGHAPDGLPEALVFRDHPFAIAVQWHPESQVADDPRQRRLFEALVARARR